MSELTEADQYLLDQIQHGGDDGWTQLVARHQGRLLAFAGAQLHNRADAEDAVQETFLGFLQHLSSFRKQASLETYLFSILRRKIADHFRGRTLHVCSLADTLGGASGDQAHDMSSVIRSPDPTASWYVRRDEAHEAMKQTLSLVLRDLVHRLKKTLNFPKLQLVELIFYAQLANKDIAALVHMHDKQVALLKHRFLKRVSHYVSQLNGEEAAVLDSSDASFGSEVFAHHALLTQIWEAQRPSCPKRSTIGAYLLHTLEPDWHKYVDFHISELGCRFCRANLDDLKQQNNEAESGALRRRIMQSTAGFFQKP